MRTAVFSLLAGLIVALIGWLAWSPYEASSQEALANWAKAEDLLQTIRAEGLPSLWSRAFQGGLPLATSSGTFLTSAVLAFWVSLFGASIGVKLALLMCLPLAALTMGLFARSFLGREDLAVLSALAYALSPALWVRMLGVEHVVVVLAMALLPLAAWGILSLARRPSALAAFLAALSCSLVTLAYSKSAIVAMPGFFVFGVWAVWKHSGVAPWLRPAVWGGALVTLAVLAVVPNLPALRESGFAVLFEFGPLEGWRQAFSSKSGLHFLDRLGALSANFRGDFAPTTGAGASYLGGIPLLALMLVFVFQKKIFSVQRPVVISAFRVSVGVGLFCFWLSHGPFGVLSGTLRALAASVLADNMFPAILWLALFAQGWVLAALLPPHVPLRKPLLILLLAVYFLVPGFPLLSWLPVFRDLRAPFDFFQVGGALWVSLASALALGMVWECIPSTFWRRLVLVGTAAAWGLDFSGHLGLAAKQALPEGTMQDFRAAAKFLKNDQRPGSVLAISGRYFYLLLPGISGRTVPQEAFQSYLQQRGFAALLAAGMSGQGTYFEALRSAGVGFVLLDLDDPQLPEQNAAIFRERLDVVYRNPHFEILVMDEPRAPAYLARDAVLLSTDRLEDISAGLEASLKNFLAIGPVLPGQSAGVIREGRLTRSKELGSRDGRAYEVLDSHAIRRERDSAIRVSSPGGGGWIVIPEAWHPDWQATQNGKPTQVFKALGGLLAVETGQQPADVVLNFRSPWWYPICHGVAGVGWLASLVTALALIIIPRFRQRCSAWGASPVSCLDIPRPPISRPLAITPTYNEATSLPGLLGVLLEADSGLHVLVIDDGSPDGTAHVVKSHPNFGQRLFLIEREGKQGLGSAYRAGFRWAVEHGYDACVEIDADLSHDPHDVPRLLEALNQGADAAIGSRYLNGLRVVNWPEHRLLLSSTATQFVRFMLGLPLTDVTSGFKALRVAALHHLDWNAIHAEGYGFQVELHFSLWKCGARLSEVPITFTERREGLSKMTPTIAVEAIRRVFDLAIPHKPTHKKNLGEAGGPLPN